MPRKLRIGKKLVSFVTVEEWYALTREKAHSKSIVDAYKNSFAKEFILWKEEVYKPLVKELEVLRKFFGNVVVEALIKESNFGTKGENQAVLVFRRGKKTIVISPFNYHQDNMFAIVGPVSLQINNTVMGRR